MRLATKLTLALTISIFVVVGVHGLWTARVAVGRMERDRARLLTERADLLAAAVSEALNREGERNARAILGRTADEVEPGRVAWLQATGAAPPEFRGSAEDWSRLMGNQGVGPFVDSSHRFIAMYRPLVRDGKVAGVLGIESSAQAAQQESRAILMNTATIALVLAVVCALVILLGTHLLVARPLAEVTQQLRRIASDDLTGRLHVRGADQLGELANEVNQLTVGLDIARRRIEDETRRRVAATAQLRHAGRLKVVGQLTASIAHELGTPLNVVSGRAHMIAIGVAKDEVAVECAQIIERQSARMAERIRGLLGFARKGVSERGSVDLAHLADGSLSLLGHMMHRAGVVPSLEVSEGGPWRTRGITQELEQVLANLITNAIQAMPGGGRLSLRVRPAAASEQDSRPLVCLEVEDEGEGMPDEVRARIFVPFFTTKEASEGTGLGLAVCADIVREHEGRIDVDSKPGVGTTFRVFLPMATAEAAAEATPPAGPETHAAG
ncbi:MAG: HAMP domain-containing histidine kinase [Deltaproteobacteria bacterium]|nr:HAMP domain-containing histidine kinase [Deltaproteobacteria bacterium]